jgi:hypothetical protein
LKPNFASIVLIMNCCMDLISAFSYQEEAFKTVICRLLIAIINNVKKYLKYENSSCEWRWNRPGDYESST